MGKGEIEIENIAKTVCEIFSNLHPVMHQVSIKLTMGVEKSRC